MRSLKDATTVLGGKTLTTSVLGQAKLAEALLEWSKKSGGGETFRKETVWGLRLDFIANNDNPFVTMFIDENKLSEFLKQLGPIGELMMESYGISLVGPMDAEGEAQNEDEIILGLCMKNDECRELWRRNLKRKQGLWGLGAMVFMADGPKYMDETELAEFIAEASVREEAEKSTEMTDESAEAWEQQAVDEGAEEVGDLDDEIAAAIERQFQTMAAVG